jgi:hypothetical protein
VIHIIISHEVTQKKEFTAEHAENAEKTFSIIIILSCSHE